MNQNIVKGSQHFAWHAQRKADVGACRQLLVKLEDDKSDVIDADLRQSLLDFYGNNIPVDPKAAQALSQVRNQPTPPGTIANSTVPKL